MEEERISVFDIFKIGVGPSSSHTLGPWRAAQQFLVKLSETVGLKNVVSVKVNLYGSLAKTGKGHGTDIAVILGLSGYDPVTIDTSHIDRILAEIAAQETIKLLGEMQISFTPKTDVVFQMKESLPFHPNGLCFTAQCGPLGSHSETYYSIGGGFVIQENQTEDQEVAAVKLPYPVDSAGDLLKWYKATGKSIWELVLENELMWREESLVRKDLLHIWHIMRACIFHGSQTEGTLPGGLYVKRRAAALNKKLLNDRDCLSYEEWLQLIQTSGSGFKYTLDWVSCFALAVNEENASYSRVVTAPTNGAAGVIPAVIQYYVAFCNGKDEGIVRFLLNWQYF